MNYTTSTYQLVYSLTKSSVFNLTTTIDKMMILYSLLLMQSNSTGTIYFYDVASQKMGIVDNLIPKNEIFSFFYKFSTYYLLQSYGLVQVSYSSSLNKISFVRVVSSLPYNTYYIGFGTTIDALYIPNFPYIYKAGKCFNQTIFDGTSSCTSYLCKNLNCLSCSMSSAVCSICKQGFIRDDLYLCVNSTIYQNQTSQQNTTNSTNSTNSTSF